MKVLKLWNIDAVTRKSVNSLGVSPVALPGVAGLCTGSEFIATTVH